MASAISTGSVVNAVVASEVAGVVVGQLGVDGDEGLELSIRDEVGHELAVVKYLVGRRPRWGYSFLMVLKQWGHMVTIFFTSYRVKVSIFCWAMI